MADDIACLQGCFVKGIALLADDQACQDENYCSANYPGEYLHAHDSCEFPVNFDALARISAYSYQSTSLVNYGQFF